MTADVARAAPLAHLATAMSAAPSGLHLAEEPFAHQLGLRAQVPSAAAVAVGRVLGAPLPTAASTSVQVGAVTIGWLGPDEWLVIDPTEQVAEPDLRNALAGAGAVVDVSAQRTTVRLAGPLARGVLAHGCALDLHPRVVPRGAFLSTVVGRAPVVVVVDDPGLADVDTSYRLMVRPSFASYLVSWLLDAAVGDEPT